MNFVQKEARNLTERVLQLQDAYEEYLDVEQVIIDIHIKYFEI